MNKKILKRVFLVILGLGIVGGLYVAYQSLMNHMQKEDEISTVMDNPSNTSKQEPYIQEPTYLGTLSALSSTEDPTTDIDPAIQKLVFDSMMQFNFNDQMTYHYEMTEYEGSEKAELKGVFNKKQDLFYEQLIFPESSQIVYYDQGTLYTKYSDGGKSSYQQKGQLQDLLSPKVLFYDFILVSIGQLQNLKMTEEGSGYRIEGQMNKDQSMFRYGRWTIEIDEASKQIVNFDIEQDGKVIQSIKRVKYSNEVELSQDEIKSLADQI